MTLVIAMILDAVFGEPKWLWDRFPHPAVVMGNTIGWATKRLNHGAARRLKGVALVVVLIALALALGWVLSKAGFVVEAVIAAILVAQKSLVQHVAAVASALRLSVADGRRAVGMIVGRDTAQMDRSQIVRGAIESAAENFSDGVIAPIFWFAVAGLPGLLVYKIINTADSMIGYKNDEFADFGWAAARIDDLVNLIPARLTALLILIPYGQLSAWKDVAQDAGKHRSPNAGWPEAAMARVLNTALSGPRSYDGALRDFAWVHPAGRKDTGPNDIDGAVRVLWVTWACAFALILCLSWLF